MRGCQGGPKEWATELLDVLSDLIALAELQDRPIIVDDPGTEHGRALLLSLGVTIREREEIHA